MAIFAETLHVAEERVGYLDLELVLLRETKQSIEITSLLSPKSSRHAGGAAPRARESSTRETTPNSKAVGVTYKPIETPPHCRPQQVGIWAIDDVESLGLHVLPNQRQGETPCAAENLDEEFAPQRTRHYPRFETPSRCGKASSTAIAFDACVGDTLTSTL